MEVRRPQPLKQGDTIGFFSPSSPATFFAPTRFERAKQFLLQQGYHLKAGTLTGESDHYRSGSIQQRADELNALIRDPDVRCIMSTIGGMNSNSLLPYIDYDALIADPKIIIGYSDMTALLLGIYQKTGIITFYGPALVASFGELAPLVDHTFTSFAAITQPQSLPYRYSLPAFWSEAYINWETQTAPKSVAANTCEFQGEGIYSGRLIGGNQNTMMAIQGTPYMPEIQHGDILLVEDSLSDIATLERTTAQLKIAGVFDRVSAIILGKHELFKDQSTGRQPIDVYREVLNGQPMPIINGFDCCHTHPMLTMPIGCTIKIDFDQHTVDIIEPWLAQS
ncbi:S66 family peptidase [Photobacterium sanguinicancri]|uniref:S66 family peptidase n=1 Tax=Photobacterium sanguinicancri TaxID=875932 RepID=UPI0021C2A12D|nr:S66 peptidase family protein [Photobacterium sanguinicancri]